MTTLREAAQQALEALGLWATGRDMDAVSLNDLIFRLEGALAESEPKTAWAHLPNAGHIDRIVAHAKEHPRKWTAAWDAAWDADGHKVGEDALSASWAVALRARREKAWEKAYDKAWSGDSSPRALESIAALIAWDDAGLLLSLPIEAVKARADEGDYAAVLIFPAMLAMREDK